MLHAPQVDDERIAQYTAEGLSAQQIADRLGCTTRTVQRARARLRAPEEVAA
nr:helix-turn-helix domain-containing protein [Streptomyces sp. SID4945]